MSLNHVLNQLWHTLIIRHILRYQAWRCERAKSYLLRHDRAYRRAYAEKEIISRRCELYAEGVSPTSSSVPDRWTLEEEMPPMAWPHSQTTS